jgi:hypothetical protein
MTILSKDSLENMGGSDKQQEGKGLLFFKVQRAKRKRTLRETSGNPEKP